MKLTGDVNVELIVLYPGLNLNLAQTAVSPAHEKGVETYCGVWGASKGPVLKWEHGVEGGVGAQLESAACELGRFVLTEWLYAGIQFKGLAKAQLLSFAVWIKREWGWGGEGYDTGAQSWLGQFLVPPYKGEWNGSKNRPQ